MGLSGNIDQALFPRLSEPRSLRNNLFHYGLGAMHMEWRDVVANIKDYHIIMVDINGHGESSHIQPYTIQSAATNVAATISEHAREGSAHVVGLSIGGFITLELARRFPTLVKSSFVSGATLPKGLRKFFFTRPTLLWAVDALQLSLPESVYWWMSEKQGLRKHEELYEHAKTNRKRKVFRDMFLSLEKVSEDVMRHITTRTLVVVGGKLDDVEGARNMALLLGADCDGICKAYVVKHAVHAWNLQDPELFAAGVIAWVEGAALPAGYEQLS